MPHRVSPANAKAKALEKAKRFLSGGGVTREDSDDELGLDDHPWEWIYPQNFKAGGNSKKVIIGARTGNFQCMIGDCVLLKAEGTNEAWIGLICNFEDGEDGEGKGANFMWFSTEKEIRNKQKKRTDALLVSLTGRTAYCSVLF